MTGGAHLCLDPVAHRVNFTMALWHYGQQCLTMALWHCGTVELWHCGTLAGSQNHSVASGQWLPEKQIPCQAHTLPKYKCHSHGGRRGGPPAPGPVDWPNS